MLATYARALFAARIVVFLLSCFISFLILGVNLDISELSFTESKSTLPFTISKHFVNLNIAVSAVTTISLLIMLLMGIKRHVFTSWIGFEAIWLGTLLPFWYLITIYAMAQLSSVAATCSLLDLSTYNGGPLSTVETVCVEIAATRGLCRVNRIIVTVYWVCLLEFAAISSRRGSAVWRKSVREAGKKLAETGPIHLDTSHPAVEALEYRDDV